MRRTRFTAFLLCTLFISTAAWANVPQTLHYSGKLDTAGGAFTGTVDVGFALYEDANAATSFWSDSQAVTVTNGRFHVELGPLSAGDVDVAALQLGVTVGTDDEMDKVAIASVPYALRAAEAGNAATVGGQAATDFAAVVHSHGLADLDIADGLNFSEFKDTMTLDASTTVQIPPADSFTFQAGTQSTGIFYGSGDVMLGLSGSSGNVSVGATPTASFKFSVSGNTRLFGDSYFSGNVGIGTAASPDHKLYIAGASYHAGGAEFDGGVGVGTVPTSSYKLTVDGDALFYGGGVGFGGAPDSNYQLRVIGDTYLGGDVIITGTATATTFVGDGMGLTNVVHTEDDPEVGNNVTGYVPKWDGTALTQGSIFDNGKVGIGTTNPQDVIDLGGATNARGLVWGGSAGTGHYASLFTTYSSGALTLSMGYKGVEGQNAWAYSHHTQSRSAVSLYPGSMRFFVDPESTQTKGDIATPTERMRITETGYVGVGTTVPKGLLHVVNTTPYDAEETYAGQDSIVLTGSVGNAEGEYYGGITWGHGARRRAGIASVMEKYDSDHVGLAFFTRGTDGPGPMYETMRIAHNGYVGIGTSEPGSQLEVNGTVTANSIQFADGTTQTTAAAANSSGPGVHGGVFYIRYNQTCPSGWSQFDVGDNVFGSGNADVCYRTDKQCLVFYIRYNQTCPSGWEQFDVGDNVAGNGNADVCYKCE